MNRLTVASWNVNSLKVRLPQVLDWLKVTGTDILGLQETKLVDALFPLEAINDAGYDVVYSGQKTYNGVALLARRNSVTSRLGPASELVTDLPGIDDPQRRVIAATYGDWRIVNLYVPNGQSLDSDKFTYKLRWLEALRQLVSVEINTYTKLLVMGDFNIAPEDRDVHDPKAWEGSVLCSAPERDALAQLLRLGLVDSFRQFEQNEQIYSWWDYRAAGFRRNRGLRIDLILANTGAAAALRGARVDPGPRALERPSDHAPTVAEFTV